MTRARFGDLPLALAALLLACSPATEPVRREPRVLHFSPAHPEATLRLEPPGDDPVALARIRIDATGPDWGAFTITDAALPRRTSPGDPAELHLRVDLDHFAADHDPHERRAGEAALTLVAGGQPLRVPLRFTPDPPPDPARWPRLAVLAGLAVLVVVRRWTWFAVLPALVFLAVAPFGRGLCPDLLAEVATTADLLQCADGRGGVPLQLLPHRDGLALALAALLLSGLVGAGANWRGLALALFAALVAAGSLDPQAVVHAQAGLRWGLWMQPLGAAALAVAALVHVRGAGSRLDALGLAALLTTLVLGGPDLPLPAGLPHAAALAAGLGAWFGKLGLVYLGLRRLPAPNWLPRLVLPLAISQILVTCGLAIVTMVATRTVEGP